MVGAATRSAVALLLMALAPAMLQAQSVSEYELKAAFVYNFAKFVTWPPDSFARPDAPFVIGVMGDDPFGGHLERIARGGTVEGREVVIRRFARNERPAAHILFICASERRRLRELLAAVDQARMLTVGDFDGFAEQGGIIHLREQAGKIRLDVNVAAADRAGLKLSSRLLQLSTLVTGTAK